MPIYTYHCNTCGGDEELVRTIASRDLPANCCRCRALLCRVFVSSIMLDDFKPQWFEHIDVNPIYIESRAQLKKECEKRGVISLGYM